MNDDELRARLRAADPARHLTGSRNLDLPEAAMSTTPTPGSSTGPTTGPRPSRGRVALAAAAAAVVVLAGIGVVIANDEDEDPTATEEPTGQPSGPDTESVTYILDAGAGTARCRPPEPTLIRALDAAFRATVLSVAEDEIVVTPTKFYTGASHGRAVMRVEGTKAIAEALPVDFEKGGSYVIAVKGNQVQLCGFTAPFSPEMDRKYTEALQAE